MKKNYLYLAALAMFTAACSNEDEFAQEGIKPSPEVKMITETIKASNGDNTPATRAAIDADANFAWSKGDQIAVHVNNGQYYTTEALAEDDGGNATADFSVTYPEGAARDAFAVFPASIVTANAQNYGQENHTLDVTLPASYTLAQVSGDKTPCPMISTNTPGGSWVFSQLCGMLRLTLEGIPAGASYLQVDFDGKQVSGDFSIASPNPGSSTISTSAITSTSASNAGDKIKISALGGATSAVINLPLPTGEYGNIRVSAVTNSNVTVKEWAFNYTAQRAKGKRIKTTMPAPSITFKQGTAITTSSSSAVDLESIIGFEFKVGENTLNNLRFVRIFSEGNLLQTTYVEETNKSTFGPITEACSNDDTDPLPETIYLGMRFNETASPIVVQAIDADGKVYSGTTTAPVSFKNGFFYKTVSVPVNLYTFTVSASKQVYFSPGDLGVDNGVYSFTEPFTAWNQDKTNMTNKNTVASKRTWFIKSDVQNGQTVYGIDWRIQDAYSEWKYLVGLDSGRKIDNGNVSLYYKVHINTTELGDRYWCYLLPPDQATYENDIKDDLRNYKEGSDYYEVSDYLKYIAKGFVLLIDTDYSYRYSTTGNWTFKSGTHTGYYQAGYHGSSKTYFSLGSGGPANNSPTMGTDWRIRTRYIHDVVPLN
ncbi:MAG: hypothetical protein IJ901_03820 [Bacteroidaceae bacterium]|nr:hypothetical protein [Bacteroidaceae bacterium]